MVAIVIRTVKGHDYYYQRWFKNSERTDVGCGNVNNPESYQKAVSLELEYLKEKKSNHKKEIEKIEQEIKKYRSELAR